MGLADFLNDPQVLAGLQMLSQSRDPQMSGQAVSGGLAQMLAMKQAEQQKAMQQQQMQLHQMQLQRMQQQQSDEAAQREFYSGAGNYMRSPQQQAIGMGGPSPQAAAMIPQLKPQFDKAAALRDMMQVPGLQQNAFAAMMKPPERMKVAANERVLDENMKELVPAIDKGEDLKGDYLVKRNGKWVVDPDLYKAHIQGRIAGRSVTPYYQFIPTPQGIAVGDARSGNLALGQMNGAPVMKSADSPELQGRISGAKEAARTKAETETKREFTMSGVTKIIDEAERIIDTKKPTSSIVGRGLDVAASAIGVAPSGASEADQLKVLAGYLVSKMPRMEGPQSNYDVQNYKEMAGDVGNPMLPLARRKAALNTLRGIVTKYDKTANQTAPPSQSGWGIRKLP